jgi:hypothetical protein
MVRKFHRVGWRWETDGELLGEIGTRRVDVCPVWGGCAAETVEVAIDAVRRDGVGTLSPDSRLNTLN